MRWPYVIHFLNHCLCMKYQQEYKLRYGLGLQYSHDTEFLRVIPQPPFRDVMELADGYLRLRAPQAQFPKVLSLAVEAHWLKACQKLKEVLEGHGSEIRLADLNVVRGTEPRFHPALDPMS